MQLDNLSDEDIECIIQSKSKLINGNTKPVFAISNLQTTNLNKIKRVRIEFDQCRTCDQEIFTLFNSKFKIQQFFMNNNLCGFQGCMTIVKNQFQSMSVSISTSMWCYFYKKCKFASSSNKISIQLGYDQITYNYCTFGGGTVHFLEIYLYLFLKQRKSDENQYNQAEMSGGGIMMLNDSISNFTFQSLNIYNNIAKNGVNNLYSKIAYLKFHIYGSLSNNQKINENLDFAKIGLQNYVLIPSGQSLQSYKKYDTKLKSFSTISINPKLLAYNQLGEQLYGIEGSQCYIYQKIGVSEQTQEFFIGKFINSYFDLTI